jgi:hypothetical protein
MSAARTNSEKNKSSDSEEQQPTTEDGVQIHFNNNFSKQLIHEVKVLKAYCKTLNLPLCEYLSVKHWKAFKDCLQQV